MANLHCPRHKDDTPSVKVYANGPFCFGGCGFLTFEELKVAPSDIEYIEPEDIEETLREVDSMPVEAFRGFVLPFDRRGHWIVWPDRSYYKCRLRSGKIKYLAPAGHLPPPYWARQQTSDTLLVVEGEFDALSAAVALPECDVMSPGSASNFNKKLLPHLKPYANVILVADADKAGLEAAMHLGSLVYLEMPGVPFRKVFKAAGDQDDFNDILVKRGKEELRKAILGLLSKEV